MVLGSQRWFLDGAHNEMSVPYAAQWFAEIVAKNLGSVHRIASIEIVLMRRTRQSGSIPRILVFSHISERDGAAMLKSIAKTLRERDVIIDQLILSTYEERLDGKTPIGVSKGLLKARSYTLMTSQNVAGAEPANLSQRRGNDNISRLGENISRMQK